MEAHQPDLTKRRSESLCHDALMQCLPPEARVAIERYLHTLSRQRSSYHRRAARKRAHDRQGSKENV